MEEQLHWTTKYLTLPYKSHGEGADGVDCWGLVKLIYRQELGILLPDLSARYKDEGDKEGIVAIYHSGREDWVKIDEPGEFDGVIMNIFGHPVHVGVMLDRDRFIHAPENTFVAIENIRHKRWERRIEGFYRHVRRT